MSDFSIKLVPNRSEVSKKEYLKQKVLEYLIRKEIIQAERTDCTLGSNEGFPPGNNVSSILINENDDNFKGLWTNGFEIVEERTVFHNGGNGIEKIECPKCNFNIIDSEWGNSIDNWYKGNNGNFNCPNCNEIVSITECNFKPNWGFSDFGFIFWNWPDLKESFIKDLEQILSLELKKVYCHI